MTEARIADAQGSGPPAALYDAIGAGYARTRRPDPRLAAAITAALGNARTVVNVGAGTGSYEPSDRPAVAVEPAAVMLAQRPAGAAPAVRARSEALPFADGAFDAALAVLTVHHWADRARGLAECARVARERVVVFTWDPAADGFWLVRDYFPDVLAVDRAIFPALPELAGVLGERFGGVEVRPVPVPADCVDGFTGAYWRRPAAYLDAAVRAGMSTFARVADVGPRLEHLRADLASGSWARRHGALLGLDALDLGYRLVVARARVADAHPHPPAPAHETAPDPRPA